MATTSFSMAKKRALIFAVFCFLAVYSTRVSAFSLLGQYESWMQPSNNFRLPFWFESASEEGDALLDHPGTIGGPMCLSNGYRWNIPVVTYGFDPSFLDYFGSNGVAAVEGAIEILNSLPPASSVVLSNYPNFSQQLNYEAESESLCDLKSTTLALLLEQLGLDSPSHYVYVLRDWTLTNVYNNWAPADVVERNFDPETLERSAYINGFLYGYQVASLYPQADVSWAWVMPLTPGMPPYVAVADNALYFGAFYTGLTADDAGGLRYLLSSNTVRYESLLPNISGYGFGSNSLVDGAWRPGVEKITFVTQPFNSSLERFLPMTNQFIDTYITNGAVEQQPAQRVTTQPDILFCAGDTYVSSVPFWLSFLAYSRTGTSNWINNSLANENPSGAGPGVIQPPIKITFAKYGMQLQSFTNAAQGLETGENSVLESSAYWGSYDGTTNAPVVYPVPRAGLTQLTMHLKFDVSPLYNDGGLPYMINPGFTWIVSSQFGAMFLFQTSTNVSGLRSQLLRTTEVFQFLMTTSQAAHSGFIG
jgi:hypothetical protein